MDTNSKLPIPLPVPRWEGDIETRWLMHSGPDRQMQLLKSVKFIDSREVEWEVPAGAIIDGASVPQLGWSLGFDPFIGDYRAATVVHDYHCEIRIRTHQEVHRVFWETMKYCAPKVPWWVRIIALVKMDVMYTAVKYFGPKWRTPERRSKRRRALNE